MMIRIAFFIFALALMGARPASAQVNANVAYQSTLLAGTLSASDQAICSGKASSKDEHDACRLTRLLLIDIANHRDKGVPPLADIKYTVSQGEISAIGDLYTKYGY